MEVNKKSLTKGSKKYKNGSLGVKPRKGKYFNCKFCSKEFYRRPRDVAKAAYCSQQCHYRSNDSRVTLNCSYCKSNYRIFPSAIYWAKERGYKNNYCSPKCQNDASIKNWTSDQRRENKKYNHTIRQSKQFKEWRKKVFERDDYTCQRCFIRGGYLEPHHIFRFSFFPEFRFTISNGATYCRYCHQLTKK